MLKTVCDPVYLRAIADLATQGANFFHVWKTSCRRFDRNLDLRSDAEGVQ